jgi:hypothetical protein
MPLHAAVAHLAVVIAPLTAFVALAYALRPASRRGMRWPLVVGSVASSVAALWAGVAGNSLYEALKLGAAAQGVTLPSAVLAHAHGSDLLTLAVVALVVVVLALVWWLLRPGRQSSVASVVAAALLAITAVATLIATGVVLQQALTAVWTLHPYWK